MSPSSTATSGLAKVGKKPCTNALYVSLIMRCDSAAMVPNTSDDLPEPDTPVNTVTRRFGSSTLTSFRLFSRAPCTRIVSWRSAVSGCLEGVMRVRSSGYSVFASSNARLLPIIFQP